MNPSEFASSGTTTPAAFGVAVTPADTDLANLTRAIYVGGTGSLEVMMAADDTVITFVGVLAGSMLPIRVSQIRAASTATDILALR